MDVRLFLVPLAVIALIKRIIILHLELQLTLSLRQALSVHVREMSVL